MASKTFIISCSIIMAVVMTLCIVTAIRNNEEAKFDSMDYRIETYYVKSGDTLWNLGQCYKDDSDDVRTWIDEVEELNGIKASNLIVGDYIKLYVAKSK